MTIKQRSIALAALFLLSWGALVVRTRSAPLPDRTPLSSLPLTIDGWRGRPGPPLQATVRAILGADEYVSRVYNGPKDEQAGLYVGFHASQKQGSSIHSPMNCLPGAGWQPVSTSRLSLIDPRPAAAGQRIQVNKVIVRNGDVRQLVLYWYQSQGRIIASEYSAKAYLFVDAVRRARTDGALVRIITPVPEGSTDDGRAQQGAVDFAEALLALLDAHLPS